MYRYQQLVTDNMSRPTSMTQPSGRSYQELTIMLCHDSRWPLVKIGHVTIGLSTVIRFTVYTYFMFGMDNYGHDYHNIIIHIIYYYYYSDCIVFIIHLISKLYYINLTCLRHLGSSKMLSAYVVTRSALDIST